MVDSRFQLITPEGAARSMSERVKALRLALNWKRETLAARSGVTPASLKRFETTGKISLQSLLLLASALDRLPEFESLLQPATAKSMAELERKEARRLPRRGRT